MLRSVGAGLDRIDGALRDRIIPTPAPICRCDRLNRFPDIRISPNHKVRQWLPKYLGFKPRTSGRLLILDISKQFITAVKKTEQREWLSQVSNSPLQQSIRDLGTAYSNFSSPVLEKEKARKSSRLNSKNARMIKLVGLELVDSKSTNTQFI